MLGTAMQETQIQMKPEECSREEKKTQGLVKAKATRLLKWSGRSYDWFWHRKGNIFSRKDGLTWIILG